MHEALSLVIDWASIAFPEGESCMSFGCPENWPVAGCVHVRMHEDSGIDISLSVIAHCLFSPRGINQGESMKVDRGSHWGISLMTRESGWRRNQDKVNLAEL